MQVRVWCGRGRGESPASHAALRLVLHRCQSFIGNFVCPRAILEDMVREGKDAGKVPVWTTSL